MRLFLFVCKVFFKFDEFNFEYQFDDGNMIEFKVYVLILLMVLVNGVDGIGIGWSILIFNYYFMYIVENLRCWMGRFDFDDIEEKFFVFMVLWWCGWKGILEQEVFNKWCFNGIIR